MEWEQQQPQYQDSTYINSNAYSYSSSSQQEGMRQRHTTTQNNSTYNSHHNKPPSSPSKYDKPLKKNLKKLDIFPKVEQDLTVQTDTGGFMTILAYILTFLIVVAEIHNHRYLNSNTIQHVSVDKSLGKKMRVDLNMTFPALHCDDVHIDIMDVAGDAHCDIVDTIKKAPLAPDGTRLTKAQITMELNEAHQLEKEQMEAIDRTLAKDYCGPCYGAGEEGECCNHCDDVVEKYRAKNWDHASVKYVAEQCVREGKTKPRPLREPGHGCNLAGFMEFGRVNGNFHIAMGEGIERNGQHIHTFLPEEVNKFNASHVIHELRFGPVYGEDKKQSKSGSHEQTSLEGVTKMVTERNGVTGMFQYFIKIVPTVYKGEKIVKEMEPNFDTSKEPILETNRYFVTERFNPLMELDEEHYDLAEQIFGDHDDDDDEEQIYFGAAKLGGTTGTSHDKHEHHYKQQAILPGVFFIYQVYPFTVEISKEDIPLTHLFIRIMATIGGVFTVVGWMDKFMHSRRSTKGLKR